VTHRGVAHEFVVVSGHVAPDDPRSLADWPLLAKLRGTLCVLMGLNHLPSIVDTLLAHGRPADTPVAVVQDGTTKAQRVVRGTLDEIADVVATHHVHPPAVVVVGDVVTALSG
jgi:Uroporphyrinogen-III methylase